MSDLGKFDFTNLRRQFIDTQNQRDELRSQNADLRERNAELEADLGDAKADVQDLLHTLEDIKLLLCPVHQQLDEIGQLPPFENCLACIRNERDELKGRLANSEQECARQALQFQSAKAVADHALSELAEARKALDIVAPYHEDCYCDDDDGLNGKCLHCIIDAARAAAEPLAPSEGLPTDAQASESKRITELERQLTEAQKLSQPVWPGGEREPE